LSVFAIRNPTPGIIINHPMGKDVYGGVAIDYRGKVGCAKCIIKCFFTVKMSAYLCICSHISKTACPQTDLMHVPVAMACDDIAIHYVLLVLWMASYLVRGLDRPTLHPHHRSNMFF